MSSHRHLAIRFPTRRALLSEFKSEGPTYTLFAPTAEEVAVGARVMLDITFGDCDLAFSIAGQVAWRRAEARGVRQEVGLLITFGPDEKWPAAKVFAACAGRPPELGTAAERRVPTSIKCRVKVGSHRIDATVTNLSPTGAFVAAPSVSRVRPGTEVELHLAPGWLGIGGLLIRAKVVWFGEQKRVAGFGVRFLGTPGAFRTALKKYLGDGSAR